MFCYYFLMKLQQIFLEMKNIPVGEFIENPYDLIETDFKISTKILHILKTKNDSIFFTRLSLKHLSEKGDQGEYIIHKIQDILEKPDNIYLGNFSNRFLISKQILFNTDKKDHIINIEITKNKGNIIVTGFIARKSYFKNLKLLWGTAPSPSQQLP